MRSNHLGAPAKAQQEHIGVLTTARDGELDTENHRHRMRLGSPSIERLTKELNIAARVLHLLFNPTEDADMFEGMDHWQVRLYRDPYHTMDVTFHTGRMNRDRDAQLPTPGCVLESVLCDASVVESHQGSLLPWEDMAIELDMDRGVALRAWESMVRQRDGMIAFLGEHVHEAMRVYTEET